MDFPLRMYAVNGCPHCVEAINYLANAKVPTHIVESSGDPIIADGIKTRIQKEAIFPILVSFITQEVLVGFKQEDYKRVVDIYHTHHRPATPDAFVVKGNDTQPPSPVATESAPIAQGTPELPAVSGDVDGVDGAAPASNVQ